MGYGNYAPGDVTFLVGGVRATVQSDPALNGDTTMAKTDVAVASKPEEDQLPDYLKGKTYTNTDNFDSSDVVIPRIKLLQGISPEIQTFDSAKIGEFWHTGLDEALGSSIKFVIADRRKKYLLSAPIEDGQGVLARADDAKTWDRLGKWTVKIKGVKNPQTWEIASLDLAESGLANWGTSVMDDSDSPPAATLFYDYLVFLPDRLDLGPAVISLARSSVRKAKKGLNDKISIHQTNGRPMQAVLFEATSVDDQSDGQQFKNWQFKPAGFVMDESLFNLAMTHKGALANIKIADEADVNDGSSSGRTEDSGEGKF